MVLPLAVWIFRTERMTWRRAVGLGMGFVGVLVILGVWQGVGGSALTGQLMCLGAADLLRRRDPVLQAVRRGRHAVRRGDLDHAAGHRDRPRC